jgi:hypothetical protein
MSNPLRYSSDGDGTAPARWSAGGFRARLAVAITLPALVGGLVASFIPWPEWQWPGFAIAAFVTALGAWLWLDATVARRLRRVARALEPGGDAHAISPGGGLSALVETAVAARIRERELERGVERLEIVRAALTRLSEDASEWAETERAPSFDTGAAPEELAPLVMRLALAAQRLEERAGAARAVAAQVRETVSDAGGRAATLAAAAERQFVEAGSLLAVLRGLERSSGDLAQGVAGLATLLASGAADSEAARAASESWARGATVQLEALERSAERLQAAGRDLARVHEEAQVAALESAHAALAAGELSSGDRVRLTDALAALLRSTRAAGARARELEAGAQAELARAHQEIGGLRALSAHFAADPAAAAPSVSDPALASRRALERVYEGVREAITRAEKLVQQAERTSSEAQRAGEGVTTAVDEVDGLVARFTEAAPAVTTREIALDAPAEAPRSAEVPEADETAEAPQRPLRVLGPEDLLPDDETWSHG